MPFSQPLYIHLSTCSKLTYAGIINDTDLKIATLKQEAYPLDMLTFWEPFTSPDS